MLKHLYARQWHVEGSPSWVCGEDDGADIISTRTKPEPQGRGSPWGDSISSRPMCAGVGAVDEKMAQRNDVEKQEAKVRAS